MPEKILIIGKSSNISKEFLKKIWRYTWKATVWFFIITILSVILFRWVPVPITPLMLIRCIEQKMDGKEMKLKKEWVPLDETNNSCKRSLTKNSFH